jgi:hypothetical protein
MTNVEDGLKKRGRPRKFDGKWSDYCTTIAIRRSSRNRLEKLKKKGQTTMDDVILSLLGIYDELILTSPDLTNWKPEDVYQCLISERLKVEREKRKNEEQQ